MKVSKLKAPSEELGESPAAAVSWRKDLDIVAENRVRRSTAERVQQVALPGAADRLSLDYGDAVGMHEGKPHFQIRAISLCE